MAGSQCPCYLLHDSLPYLHQSLHEAGNREGGLQGRRGASVCGSVQVRREETRKETRKQSKQRSGRKMKHQRKTRRQRSKSEIRQGSEVIQQRPDRPGPTLRGSAQAWRTGPVATSADVIRVIVFTSCLITFRWRRDGCQVLPRVRLKPLDNFHKTSGSLDLCGDKTKIS